MRVRLLQARTANDPVRGEERVAFARRLELPPDLVLPHDLITEGADPSRVTDGVDAVLVGGSGAFSVLDDHTWVRAFIDLLGHLSEGPLPLFASCFGFQALVLAHGGEVIHDAANAEVGTYELTVPPTDDPLFGPLPPRVRAQLGHQDRASRLPASLVHLAASERCPHQAVRVRGLPVWATQFHPELDARDNLTRFLRYEPWYRRTLGDEAFEARRASFLPSPEADALLRRWRALTLDRPRAPTPREDVAPRPSR